MNQCMQRPPGSFRSAFRIAPGHGQAAQNAAARFTTRRPLRCQGHRRLAAVVCAAWVILLPCVDGAFGGQGASGTPGNPFARPAFRRLFAVFGADWHRLREIVDMYDVVMWHNHPRVRSQLLTLHLRKPSLKALMYRNLMCILREETPLEESVGGYDWISAHHPEWFILDARGERVEVPDYPGRWMMDFRNPDWQQFWITRTLKDVVDGGWDGVMVDDAITSITAHDLPSMAGYPDDAALQDAVYGFLKRIGEAFRERDKLVVANVSSSYRYPGLWARWLAVVDGLGEEHFAGEGWTWGDDVAQRQMEAMREAAGTGKWMFCLTYGGWDDRARMETSLAAFLVGVGPRTYWSYRPDMTSHDPIWDVSWIPNVGEPLGEPVVEGAVWVRRFERGAAAVNVGQASQQVELLGRPVTLPPLRGTIVLEDADAQGVGARRAGVPPDSTNSR